MNYKKIYYDLCNYCSTVDKVERIRNRNLNDPRLLKTYDIYTEIHHIIPKHSGGSDDKGNLVEMLPEEHLMAHLIRYKAYGDRGDFIAARFIINGFNNKSYLIDRYPETFVNNKTLLKKYGLFRDMVAKFRKEEGWQSEDGRKRISNARKGTFPCVDAVTGESVGSHHRNHPKVVSGEWVHHSRGMVNVINLETGMKEHIPVEVRKNNPEKYKPITKSGKGSKNNNYKEMTPAMRYRIMEIVSETSDGGYFVRGEFERVLKEEFNGKIFKKVSMVWVLNNFGDVQSLVNETNSILGTNIKYSRKRKSKAHRKSLSIANKGYVWVTNGEIDIRMEMEESEGFLRDNPEFKRGRKKECCKLNT